MTHTQSCKQCGKSFESEQKIRSFCSYECVVLNRRELASKREAEKASSLPDRITAFYIAQAKGVAGYQVEKKRLREHNDWLYKNHEMIDEVVDALKLDAEIENCNPLDFDMELQSKKYYVPLPIMKAAREKIEHQLHS